MSIIKNMHRIISDIEELQDEYAKADNLRLSAQLERDELKQQFEALRQAHWDGRAIGGFDNDGDPTPAAVVSDFAELIKNDWAEMRRDLDNARSEVDTLLSILRDYPKGQDDGQWIKRRNAAMALMTNNYPSR